MPRLQKWPDHARHGRRRWQIGLRLRPALPRSPPRRAQRHAPASGSRNARGLLNKPRLPRQPHEPEKNPESSAPNRSAASSPAPALPAPPVPQAEATAELTNCTVSASIAHSPLATFGLDLGLEADESQVASQQRALLCQPVKALPSSPQLSCFPGPVRNALCGIPRLPRSQGILHLR